jgi:hypothetical protein
MNKAASKSKKGTVGSAFKASLAELMSEMSVAAPHFVRCIKPNEQKVSVRRLERRPSHHVIRCPTSLTMIWSPSSSATVVCLRPRAFVVKAMPTVPLLLTLLLGLHKL